MNNKSVKVKNFIKDVGTKNQLFVFAGYNPNPLISDTNESSINLWNYSDFSVRIGQNSVLPVVPYVKWIRSRPYNPWFSTKPNSGNFYAYNDQNGYVYLCISNNNQNRIDLSEVSVSTMRPNHTAGIQRYSDGYAWKPLYKITPSIERFVSSAWLPVLSFDLYDSTQQVNQFNLTKSFCGSSSTSLLGRCAIYTKVPLRTDTDTGIKNYKIGDIFATPTMTCGDCFYLMYKDDKFVSVFYPSGQTIPNTITIQNNYDLVGSLIASNQISSSSPYYYLYEINQNSGLMDGSVISAFIDLNGFNFSNLVSKIPNPELTVSSNTGTGARIRLTTFVYQGSHVINGIEVIEPGSGYRDISITLDQSIVNIDISALTNAININLDTVDTLGFDPVDILNAQHYMVDARLEKKTIEESGIRIPDKLNFFGIIQNPSSTSQTNQIISGSDKNQKLDVIYRTTIAVGISAGLEKDLPSPFDTFNNVQISDGTTSSTLNNISIGGRETPTSVGGQFVETAEIKNVPYSKSNLLVGAVLDPETGATITDIKDAPEFIQYSGKFLSSKKLNSDLSLSDTDSVIIRINIVEGM